MWNDLGRQAQLEAGTGILTPAFKQPPHPRIPNIPRIFVLADACAGKCLR